MTALYLYVPSIYFFAYFIFFSALIVTIRSDLETMLISRFATLFMIPLGFCFAYLRYLPITITDSFYGMLFGYGFLFIISKLFKWLAGKDGMGEGDLELLAFIGSFIGLLGCWVTLLIGSILGSVIGIGYMFITKSDRSAKIPFGPFLAIAAILFVLFQECFISLLFYQYI